VSVVRQTIDAEPEYVGATLATREENFYDDSDFYAVVYDAKTNSLRRIDYGSTRYAGQSSATVDATEDVLEKAERALGDTLFRLFALDDLFAAEKVAEGVTVEVSRTIRRRKGRHVQQGERGEVVRFTRGFGEPYAEKYGRTPPMRALVRLEDGEEAWINDDDVFVPWDVVGERLTPLHALRVEADVRAKQRRFYEPFVRLGVAL
jgi:hypothetical protein